MFDETPQETEIREAGFQAGTAPATGHRPAPQRIPLRDLAVGQSESLTRIITDADIAGFAAVSGDHNPVHLDDEIASQTVFGGRIAHGMLTAALISALIGERLPGHGSVYLGQSLRFHAPVRPGDKVRAEVTVTKIDRERRQVTLDTTCLAGERLVLSGEALVLVPAAT